MKRLVLCKGCKIMLTQNINTGIGLVNGSLGTVYDFVNENGVVK